MQTTLLDSANGMSMAVEGGPGSSHRWRRRAEQAGEPGWKAVGGDSRGTTWSPKADQGRESPSAECRVRPQAACKEKGGAFAIWEVGEKDWTRLVNRGPVRNRERG